MKCVLHRCDGPGLLVSVRNAAEALAALRGGADVVDVKEPDRGPLGAADPAIVAEIVAAVNDRAPVSAAMGELTDLLAKKPTILADGVSLFKIGLAGCRSLPDWRTRWRDAITALAQDASTGPRPVAVAYADWRSTGAPEPDKVLSVAVEDRCPALLVDTFDKSTRSLFDHWPVNRLSRFLHSARSHGLMVVLAGSLINETIVAAASLKPDLVAVRGAACNGGRRGNISVERVRALRKTIQSVRRRPTLAPHAVQKKFS